MDKNGSDNIRLMVGGWIGGSSCSIPLLFVGSHHVLDFIIKFIGLMIAGFVTGLFTVLGHDFYKIKIKPRLFKTNKNDQDDTRRITKRNARSA